MMTLSAAATASIAAFLLGAAAAHAQTPDPQPTDPIDITVQGKRIKPDERMERTDRYDAGDIERADAFTVQELLKTLPPGPPGTKPVILIDGKETPFDLSTLPVELLERLEVNRDGERPDGKPRAEGYVINVITRENYTGAGLNMRLESSFAGGGDGRELAGNAAYKRGPLHVVFTATHTARASLLASERDYARDQDHTAEGGRDYRLPLGYPPAVQSLDGPLNGLTDAAGQPVTTAIAPDTLPPGGLTAGDFLAGGVRHFTTAEYLYLTSPAEDSSVGLQLRYPLTQRVQINAQYSYQRSQSDSLAPPPVTTTSDGAIVPAAYNPFGQDIAIGLVHTGFGSVRGDASSDTHTALVSVDGPMGENWRWTTRAIAGRTDGANVTRELDPELFAAALVDPDPARRFDPFAPETNQSRYSALTRLRDGSTQSSNASLHANMQGALSEGWVGPVFLNVSAEGGQRDSEQTESPVLDPRGNIATRGENVRTSGNLSVPVFKVSELTEPAAVALNANWSRDEQTFTSESDAAPPSTDIKTLAVDTSLRVPWVAAVDERPGLRQLETVVSVGQASQSGEDAAHTENVSVLWAPTLALTVRARVSENQIPPPIGFYQLTYDYNLTLLDPRRNEATATGVQVESGVPVGLEASFSRAKMLEVQFTPPKLKDLRLGVNYNVQSQRNQVRALSAQDIVDNEAALAARVTRLPPTEADIAAGQPGAISYVDVTPLNAGAQQSSSLDVSVQYRGPDTAVGSLHFSGRARRILKSENELLPGVPLITSDENQLPPDWTFSGQADWRRGPWSVRGGLAYRAEGYYAGEPYATYTTVDLGLRYRFARRLQVGAQIGNLFDAEPPRVDTLTGYLGGSPLGRVFQLTLRVPLGTDAGKWRGRRDSNPRPQRS